MQKFPGSECTECCVGSMGKRREGKPECCLTPSLPSRITCGTWSTETNDESQEESEEMRVRVVGDSERRQSEFGL